MVISRSYPDPRGPRVEAPSQDWLIGAGEIADLIRSMDWSATPLGARDEWPPSLRTAVNLILASRFPMAVLWGRELIMIYNEGYRTMAADQHPRAMGKSNRETWPEVWHLNGPIFDKVMTRGEAVYLEDQLFPLERKGFLEEAYFTLCFSPIYLESGAIGGTLATLLETTERLAAEKALKEREAELREAQRLAHLGSWTLDVRTGQLTLSDEVHRIFGRREPPPRFGEFTWEGCAVYGPDEQARVQALVERCLRENRPYEFESEIIRPDGTRRTIFARGEPVAGASGEVTKLRGMVLDITERKRAEAAAQAQRQLLQSVLDHLPAAVCVIGGSDQRIQFMNPAYAAIAPGKKEMVGKTLDELWSETKHEFGALCRRVLETGEPHHAIDERYTIRRADDGPLETAYFSWSLFRVRLPGETDWSILNIAWETTARKRTEERFATEHEALALLHRLGVRLVGQDDLDTLLQAVLDAAIDLTGAQKGTFQLYDAASRSLRIVAHRGFERSFLEHFSIVDHGAATCGKAMRDGERVIVEDISKSPIFLGTPSLAVLEAAGVRACQSTPVKGRDGSLLCMVSTHWSRPHQPDEGALQRLDLLVREAADLIEYRRREKALMEASRAKDQFIAALSHELRTPLTPAVAALSLLRTDVRLPADVRADLDMVSRNIDLEVRLIADLLDVSRIISGKLHLEKRPTDVALTLREAMKIVGGELDAKGQTLTVETPGAPYLIAGDAARLQQMFWNLLRNASKFTPIGGHIVVRARVRPADRGSPGAIAADAGGGSRPGSESSGQELFIEVSDTGSGIAADMIPRIFDAFQQSNEGRAFGGLGLGLSISKAVVEMHGGVIAAHSDGPGKGSTFTVRLPITDCLPSTAGPVPSPAIGPQRRGAAGGGDLPGKGLRIVLVEDHEDTAIIMSRILSAEGYQVTIAGTVAEGLTAVERARPDLLISDLGLPDGSGLDLVRQLAQRGSDIPAIALSGYGAVRDLERSKAAGFVEHITKPVDFASLKAAIARYR
jgi:PAS domain S-box-containing protein